MDDIFFSGTFSGESLSIAAALATLEKLEATDAPAVLARLGKKISSNMSSLLLELGLNNVITMTESDWWPRMTISRHERASQLEVTSLLRQEFLAHGLLLTGGFNLSMVHSDASMFEETMRAIRSSLDIFNDHLSTVNPVANLRGKQIQPVFQVR